MDRMSRDRCLVSVPREASALRQELAAQYPDLPVQSVALALDQATRAAALLD